MVFRNPALPQRWSLNQDNSGCPEDKKITLQNMEIHLLVLIHLFYLQLQVLIIIEVPVDNTSDAGF